MAMLAILWCVAASTVTAQSRPNIVLLVVDDLGYGEIGPHAPDPIPTPNIDRLASRGVRFTNGYVSAPYCTPSRAGLITGRYQTRFGYELNPTGAANEDPRVGLPPSEITISELLQDAGYTTGLVGKWHLGGTAAYHPLRNGFDEFFGFLHEGHYFVPAPYKGVTTWMRRKALPDGGQGRWTSSDGRLVYSTHLGTHEPDYNADNPIVRNSQPVNESEYLTDAFTREAVDFIERQQDRPFLLYVAYNAVHSPMQATDAYMERFKHIPDIQRRIFAAMLSNVDDSVGEIMKKLESEGLEENTLVFFVSDHGGPTKELTSNNEPLRGGKGDLYEGGIRVPFIAQWPGRLPAGKTEDRPVISLDIFASAAAAAGVSLPEDRVIDGVDLLPYVLGDKAGLPHEKLFWRIGNKGALRMGDWKLVANPPRRNLAVRDWELYNLAEDISESTDLSDKNPAKARELRAAWDLLETEMQDPFWPPGQKDVHDPFLPTSP